MSDLSDVETVLFRLIYSHEYVDGVSGTWRDCQSLAAVLAPVIEARERAAAREVLDRINQRLDESRQAAPTTLAADWLYRQGLMDAAALAADYEPTEGKS